MERNPYNPPSANVADVSSEQPIERPSSVTLAVRLLWLSLVIGIGGLFVAPRQVPGVAGIVVVAVIGLIVFGIYAWLIAKIGAGRNWARITYTVLTVIGYLVVVFTWNQQLASFKASPISAVISGVNAAINLYVLYLLYTKTSKPWFSSGVQAVR